MKPRLLALALLVPVALAGTHSNLHARANVIDQMATGTYRFAVLEVLDRVGTTSYAAADLLKERNFCDGGWRDRVVGTVREWKQEYAEALRLSPPAEGEAFNAQLISALSLTDAAADAIIAAVTATEDCSDPGALRQAEFLLQQAGSETISAATLLAQAVPLLPPQPAPAVDDGNDPHGAAAPHLITTSLPVSRASQPTQAPAPSGATPAVVPASGAGVSSPIAILASGVGQARPGGSIVVAALVRNSGAAADLIPVSMTVYDAGGSLIAAGETTLHYIGAGVTTGLAHRLTSKNMGVAARVDMQAGAGRAAGEAPAGAFSFAQAGLSSSRSALEASAVMSSTYAVDLSEVHVNAIVYDGSGGIIGGGATIKRLVPAGGQVGVVLSVEVSGVAARVELYAQLP